MPLFIVKQQDDLYGPYTRIAIVEAASEQDAIDKMLDKLMSNRSFDNGYTRISEAKKLSAVPMNEFIDIHAPHCNHTCNDNYDF